MCNIKRCMGFFTLMNFGLGMTQTVEIFRNSESINLGKFRNVCCCSLSCLLLSESKALITQERSQQPAPNSPDCTRETPVPAVHRAADRWCVCAASNNNENTNCALLC